MRSIGELMDMKKFIIPFSALSLIALAGMAGVQSKPAPAPALPDGPIVQFPDKPEIPKDNPMTPEKIELGKKLYFDTRLSKTNKISCNTCHDVMKAGDDGLPFSPGHDGTLGGRNSPTVLNSAFWSVQFWDGRAPSLEEQAKGPIINPVEMGMANHNVVVELISKVPAYVEEFEKVFGPGKVTIKKLVQAIAAYERTLITPNSPYDRFVAGDKKAMNASAQRGWRLFGSVGCLACHGGPMFNGPQMQMGQGFYQKFPLIPDADIEKKYAFTKDTGRHAETKKESDKNMWRVPSLRNVGITAPYFHNGAVSELDEAVRIMAKTQTGRVLTKEESKDIAEFLRSLTGVLPKQTLPQLPN
jgi:cytochrome c peroxidase